MFGFGGIRRTIRAAVVGVWCAAALLVVPGPAAAAAVEPPVNLVLPAVVGTARSGEVVGCSAGTWSGAPTSYGVVWLRDGWPIADGTALQRRLVDGDVGHTIACRVRMTNDAGSATATSAPQVVAAARTVAPPPTSTACTGSPAVVVAGGADWTRSRTVELRVRTPVGATRVEIANRPDFADVQRRSLSARCAYSWQLPALDLATTRTVYVRFPGAADPVTAVSDAIRLDGSAPVIVRAHARWRNSRHGWVLTVRAEDAGAGLMWFQVSRRDGTVRRTYGVRSEVVTWDRSVIERVRFADRLGNRTGWVRVQFLS